MTRRAFLLFVPLGGWAMRHTLAPLTPPQSRLFRAWMVRIVGAQLRYGPSPRWYQRDCVGLVRFAVAEALRPHDLAWQKASNLGHAPLPPPLSLTSAQQQWRHRWRDGEGHYGAYVRALDLIQHNTHRISRNVMEAQRGDLLFFDQGDAQHVMIWMGSFIAYHTGSVYPQDNGLRALNLADLLQWNDTRWRPSEDNPNFGGVYRLNFLTA